MKLYLYAKIWLSTFDESKQNSNKNKQQIVTSKSIDFNANFENLLKETETANLEKHENYETSGFGQFSSALYLSKCKLDEESVIYRGGYVNHDVNERCFIVRKFSNFHKISDEGFETISKESTLQKSLDNEFIQRLYTSILKTDVKNGTANLYHVYNYAAYGSSLDLLTAHYKFGLPYSIILYFTFSILKALIYLKNNFIIHRSIRAEHLLINQDGGVKLSCFRHAVRLERRRVYVGYYGELAEIEKDILEDYWGGIF